MEFLGELIGEFKEVIAEIVALFHILSDVESVLELLSLMSQHGSIEGLLLWVLLAILSSLVAEVLKSRIPTVLRPLFKILMED